MKKIIAIIMLSAVCFAFAIDGEGKKNMKKFLEVSKENPHYFVDLNGKTFIPIGLNLCFFRPGLYAEKINVEETYEVYRNWFDKLAENGGNYTRLWIGSRFFDVMPEKPWEFSAENLEHIKTIMRYAEERNIKVKITLEQFRTPNKAEVVSFGAPVYQSLAKDMKEWCESEECRRLYLAKAKYIADAIGSSPSLVAVELWNEIGTIGPTHGYVGEWSDYMFKKLQEIFPQQMIVQNLGSYDNGNYYGDHFYLCNLPNNGFYQVHRYLDPGSYAHMQVCQAPMDILCAESIRDLKQINHDKPLMLAETGAVKPNHSGASILYEVDKEGALLHDIIFAPFFAGSAGTGQSWYWDFYVDRWNLWWHFKRFATAIEGIDPVKEDFKTAAMETKYCRVYALHGKTHNIYWFRDKFNTWENEFIKCQEPQEIQEFDFPIWALGEVTAYLPWDDKHITPEIKDRFYCKIPKFKRSLVLRVKHDGKSRYLKYWPTLDQMR